MRVVAVNASPNAKLMSTIGAMSYSTSSSFGFFPSGVATADFLLCLIQHWCQIIFGPKALVIMSDIIQVTVCNCMLVLVFLNLY